jgi:hypothetical protein
MVNFVNFPLARADVRALTRARAAALDPGAISSTIAPLVGCFEGDIMKTFLAPLAGASLIVLAPAVASAQPTAALRSDEAAKLSEARAVIEIMFPPAQRQSMFDKLQNDMITQLRPSFPAYLMSDPGLKAIIDNYIQEAMKRQRPVLQKHLPEMLEGMAVAYAHEFSVAELKEIHSFAQTPAGSHYLSKSMAMVGDPAVAKANTAMITEMHTLTAAMLPGLKEKVIAYLKAHPDVAAKIQAEAKGK